MVVHVRQPLADEFFARSKYMSCSEGFSLVLPVLRGKGSAEREPSDFGLAESRSISKLCSYPEFDLF